ncbi:carboxy terminal-processing peptidase [Trichloromonas sp.]|uniref:carboxy terminal-processing peptidase n=1 Tax=Trichloromonas sp. TaxID=3069249 RepID=UPI002A3C9AD5|nr:carboxy terminal-processing peptidase [Trichloromonas sp.]
MSSPMKKLLFVCLALIFSTISSLAALPAEEFDINRARLLSFILRGQINQNHYSQKPIDDTLSRAAFDLYLKQLDGQKRFLLKEDADKLEGFATRIDDEINRGRLELASLGARMMSLRLAQVEKLAGELIEETFDFSVDESLETDPEKLDFCKDEAELRERWRKILKFQVLVRYLNLLEDEEEKAKTEGKKLAKTEAQLLETAREKVRKSNADFFDRMRQETEQDHYDRYFNAITRAFDPHTNYLPPQTKEDFDISMSGSLEGIGATLQEEDGYIKVIRIIPGSASSRQGQLQAEDIILEVAQGKGEPVDVTDARLRDAVSLIRGKKGTEVRLTVKKPDGRRLIIPIIRDVVQIEETFVKGTILKDEKSSKKFGYIRIPSFYRDFKNTVRGGDGRNSTDDVREELRKMTKAGIDGLVLDLRNNGGGALTDAVSITGLFIEKGPVVQIKNRNGRINVLSDQDPAIDYRGPMVVLINKFSASASEILAGALQDYRRAVIIGSEHSYGKGTVQTMADLDANLPFINLDKYRPLGAMKVTTQKFYRVSGESTQYRGVVPDIILPDPLRHVEAGEQYVDNSLHWDSVERTSFTPWNPPLALPPLVDRSHERVAANEEFNEILTETERAKIRREQTRQSLAVEVVRKEREEEKKLRTSKLMGHGAMGMEDANADEKKDHQLDEVEREKEWLKELAEDPYVGESRRILLDMAMPLEQKLNLPALADQNGAGNSVYSRP